MDTLNRLLMWEEPDVQYNAAGALFNMMAMSGKLALCLCRPKGNSYSNRNVWKGDFTSLICSKCLNSFITVILETNRERVQLTCAKALLMLGIRGTASLCY